MAKITRTVAEFDPVSELHIRSFEISGIDWDELKDIFDPADQDPEFIGTYDIEPYQAILIEEFVDGKMDLSRFIYQLDYEQVD